ncbi:piggyBac transposable element-derived protein 3-like [Sitophilus oryzae]|uniref:PiggyBac transposable element-derived protein 3-like n=1 Tax=Sitophilus oryzae TaxID=7048 RepID=A0A6J2X6D4_SITOR|nr:piggyBac transposable element-derived protein 3-like [Sitophilus oryzae]
MSSSTSLCDETVSWKFSGFIHFADNSQPDAKDKIWKLRTIMDKVKSNCLKLFEPEEHLCFDESVVKYYGRHGCKQFIRGKPIRFGYKMWCLNTPSGYVVDFEMYQGNNPRRCEEYETLFGKSAAPLVVMLDELVNVKGFHPYKLYVDNLFAGITLFKFLRDNGYQATGTVRDNRLPKNIPLSNKKKTMAKRTRASHESIIDKSDGIIIVRWVDNSVVM